LVEAYPLPDDRATLKVTEISDGCLIISRSDYSKTFEKAGIMKSVYL